MPNAKEQSVSSKISSTNIGGRTILAPQSSITYENCSEIEKKIEDAIQQNKTELILDCKNIAFLDSAALELLIQTHTDLISRGGALKIIGLNDVCRDILLATRIINLLFVYKDMHEAISHKP
jgi:anti-anti-sigma factor